MKERIPLIITFVTALIIAIQFFSPALSFLQERLTYYVIVVAIFAYILGLFNLITVHFNRISRSARNIPFSLPLLIGLIAMMVLGIGFGIEEGTVFYWLFDNLQVPMSAAMFSLLAFFIASAAYRAFKARNTQAALLLVAAVIVMLGRVPIGSVSIMGYLKFDAIAEWIMTYPNMAGQRAIMIGAALGVVATSLRIMLGIERTYMGEE
jgi:hypothetical protein